MTHKVVFPSTSSGIYRTSDRKRYGEGIRHLFEAKPKGGGMGSILLGGAGSASSYESMDEYRKTVGTGLKHKLMTLKPKRHNINFDI